MAYRSIHLYIGPILKDPLYHQNIIYLPLRTSLYSYSSVHCATAHNTVNTGPRGPREGVATATTSRAVGRGDGVQVVRLAETVDRRQPTVSALYPPLRYLINFPVMRSVSS
ncbi:hypothetical protein GWI33_003176 [Rhynchophorus ferrugineus]|uniref:Uncharacterized protein n=1 Tax=Rhynchophorus ferrugineus TaxID=354439 RepID=A0A834IUY4_RHYFE|nr:hypothetical protein GWI33_003176 [Rhynchophorus ferrugineus]